MSRVWASEVHKISAGDDGGEVMVTDGQFSCVAFSWPCSVQAGDEIVEPLGLLGITLAARTFDVTPLIERLDPVQLGHRLVATIVRRSTQLLAVGAIRFVADDALPADLVDGDSVEIVCGRIDLR